MVCGLVPPPPSSHRITALIDLLSNSMLYLRRASSQDSLTAFLSWRILLVSVHHLLCELAVPRRQLNLGLGLALVRGALFSDASI